MKKHLIFALLLCLVASYTMAQTIRRVNTNPAVTGTNVYSTLQEAHDAATNGDIIIVEASSISCGNLVSTKSLKIYGKGYFTGINSELHVSPDPSLVGTITFEPGSDNSEVSGLTLNYIYIYGTSNIRIYRNRVINDINIEAENSAGTDIAISNIQIAQNYLERYLYVTSTTQGISTVSITNNYLPYAFSSTSNITGLIINNNTIEQYVTLHNATFQNNILFSTGTSSTFTNCIVTNNVVRANDTDFNAGTDNLIGNLDITSATTGFIIVPGNPLTAGISEDERWQIKAGSPMLTAGTSGTQVGMYGGFNPYVPSGIPGAPSITKLLTPDYGNTAAPLSVTISVKSNN